MRATVRRRIEEEVSFPKAVVHVDLRHVENMRHEASAGEFTLTIDEGEEGGGDRRGPSPLVYFLTGAAACYMTWFVRLAAFDSVDLKDLEVNVRGHFERRVRGGFEKIIYDVKIRSDEKEDVVRRLAAKAADFCYVHNTLKRAGVVMQINLHLNERMILQES